MAVLRAEAQRDIIAEPEDVWRVMTDVQRYPRMLRSVESSRPIEGVGFDVGLVWDEQRRIAGKLEHLQMRITECKPGKRVLIEGRGDSGVHHFDYIVAPSSLGTRLRIEYAALGDGGSGISRAAQSMIGMLGVKGAKAGLDEDLEDFAKACEDRVRR